MPRTHPQIPLKHNQTKHSVCSVWDKGYRYGFNGKEIDKGSEGMGGGGSTYDYGFRIYNPSLGRFLSVDPLTDEYPMLTPYQFASNMPISAIDLDGLEAVIVITGKATKTVKHRGKEYLMYEVHVYNNMTLDQYNSDKACGTLRPPDKITYLARDAWQKNSKRSNKRYGTYNETPNGTYWLGYGKFGNKGYKLKVSDTKTGDEIVGPDGKRSNIRIHHYFPKDAVGCFTTCSNDVSSVDDFIDLIPELKENEDVRLIVEERKAVLNNTTHLWEGEKHREIKLLDLNLKWPEQNSTDNTYLNPNNYVKPTINTTSNNGCEENSSTNEPATNR